jgi:hypothetical protein
MQQIRLAYPRSKRIYLIQDNLSCHWTPAIRNWAARNNVELVPTPTYANYVNRIESPFGAIGEFVIKNADLPRLGQLRARTRTPHQLPQTTPTDAANGSSKPTGTSPGRLSHEPVSGATLREAALAPRTRTVGLSIRAPLRSE